MVACGAISTRIYLSYEIMPELWILASGVRSRFNYEEKISQQAESYFRINLARITLALFLRLPK